MQRTASHTKARIVSSERRNNPVAVGIFLLAYFGIVALVLVPEGLPVAHQSSVQTQP